MGAGALGLALLAAAAAGAEEPPPLPAAQVQAIGAAISRVMARDGIPGLTAAVVAARQVRWVGAFGVADIENAVPARPETVFRIASLTKPITATAVLQLVEKGKIELDAPIQRYVPAYPEKRWSVTVRQLLVHQGGVRHLADAEWGSTRHYASLLEALDVYKDDPLLFEPGTRALYSTYGFCLLGSAVEAAAGAKFGDHLQKAIFEPAGMDHTRTDDPLQIIPNRAPGYARTPSGALRNSILADTSNKIPGGGLCSTAGDMARFAAALESDALLTRQTLEGMFTRQRTRDGKSTEYGLGWLVDRRKGRREVWQHGGQPQVSTLLYLQPDRGFAVVLLSNLEGVSAGLLEVARSVADAVR